MAEPSRRPATYEGLKQVPEWFLAQIIGGELVVLPPPGLLHARVASVVGSKLGEPFDHGSGGPGGWWILFEPEFHLGSEIVVPDLAGRRRERLPSIPDAPFHTLAPDWVCEVLSPSTARLDRLEKLALYAREGVDHAWIIDPLARTLEAFRRQGASWLLITTHGGDRPGRIEPFDAVEIDVRALWSGLPKPLAAVD